MERNPWLQALLILLVIIAGYYIVNLIWQLGQQMSDIILTFFLAWLLAFVLNPMVKFLERYNRQKRILAVIEIYIGLILFLILLGFLAVPAIAAQSYQLASSMPAYINDLPQAIIGIQSWFWVRGMMIDLSSLFQSQAIVQSANALGTMVAQNALGIAQFLASAVTGLFIVLVLSFYMVLDGDRISRDLLRLLPQRYQEEAHVFMRSIDTTFGGYIRGVLTQAVIYAAGTALVMAITGLGFIGVVSTFAGAMMVIPFLGGFLAIIPVFVLAVLSGSVFNVLFVLAGLLALQQVVLNVVAPKVMSDNVGIHPLLVFLAILLGLKLAGIWGAIFGVPVAGVVNAMALYFINRNQAVDPFVTAGAGAPPVPTGSPRQKGVTNASGG